ncbi:hypothetical protein C2845_PM16G20010 [Panicum miliaceum]|uniref:DUF1618 domain-containing protein n=1 Tax=Panicum miliaceum TaxID=4540 RepID=A0A3L6Q0Z8_PANMI|nr:hypothetical protein C2845_PM16G20010 [Panicum miliaceum]
MLPPEYSPGIPLFDTETAGMTVWPNPQSRGDFGSKPWYISVGGRLLAFVYPFVEVLAPQPPPTDRSWSWDSVEPPPPFVSSVVTGYAVHPDGRTVFVSVRDWRPDIPGKIYILKSRRSTFTFDMERLEWAHAGEWLLPFKGRAYYDRELDAWVGLCLHREAAGRVCCCDVPPAPPAGAGCETMPAWKLGRDVFFGDPGSALGHLGATLLSDSTFCVVEGGIPMDCDGDTRTRVVKMTCFRLKYGKDGDLCTTHHRAYASLSYGVAHERMDRTQNPVAFWM